MAPDQQRPSQNPEPPENPFLLDQSENEDSFDPLPPLLRSKKNYPEWFQAMSEALASKIKPGFLDGTIAVPAEDDAAYGAWNRTNELVLSWIVKSVDSKIGNTIDIRKDKAVDVWRKLRERLPQVPEDQSIHPHPLKLKQAGSPYTCSGCQQRGTGSRYRCGRKCCVLHEECATAVADSIVGHRFFKGSKFRFLAKPAGTKQQVCDACRKIVRGFVYHCSATKKYLHPCCFHLEETIPAPGKEGHVTLQLLEKIPRNGKCLKCKKRAKKNGGWSYSYVSSDGKYCCCYHVSCIENKELILEPELGPTGKIVKVRKSSNRWRTAKVLMKMATLAVDLLVSVVLGSPSPNLISAALVAVSDTG